MFVGGGEGIETGTKDYNKQGEQTLPCLMNLSNAVELC